MRPWLPLLAALAAVVAVAVPYLALGGASYEPTPTADPCATREWRDPGGLQEVLEQVALSGLDGAACDLGVSREELVLALRDEETLDRFAAAQGISRAQAEAAMRRGLVRAVDDAEHAGVLPELVAGLLREGAERIPPSAVLDLLERLRGLVP